jgi:hypothetical protein
MINNKHYFDTAHYPNYEIAKAAADKAGMTFNYDYRANCFKCYHFDITATTPEQDAILTNIILACTAHRDQEIYRKKVIDYIYA